MTSLGIIPARFASSRFPGKPLADVFGKSMIRRVYEQASQAGLDDLVIATDDERIYSHVQAFGGQVILTSAAHLSGTDWCAEVAGRKEFSGFDFVVNIQGDEPFLQPSQIDLALQYLSCPPPGGAYISTLAKKIEDPAEFFNPNVVKVVFGTAGNALYFSRQPVPFLRGIPTENWLAQGEFFKHVGLYAFGREALLEISKLPPSRLELAESLEQLRWLENGYKIGVSVTQLETFGIDTPEDLAKVDSRMRES